MHKMKQKKQFTRPAILQELSLLGESPILNGTVVDNTTIVSTGQEVQDWDFENDFDHNWEE